MKRLVQLSTFFLVVIILASCKDNLSVTPHDGKTFEDATSSIDGLKTATQGTYGLLVVPGDGFGRPYASFILNMGSAPGDNVSLEKSTGDPIMYNYDYQRSTTDTNIKAFWEESYKIIYACNQNIAEADVQMSNNNISSENKITLEQLKGENLFLRAKTYFDLVRVFGRPYTQNPDKNLGVPVVTKPDPKAKPARLTVKAVYKQIVNDLMEANSLMTILKNSSFASKTAGEALLSRVYLHMEENEKVVAYSDTVISSGRYKLLSTQNYPNLFSMGNINNPEDIFAIHHDENQNFKNDSYSSLYYKSPEGVGWGQWYASKQLRDLLDIHLNDVRRAFIKPEYEINSKGDTTGIQKANGIDIYYITKFTGQYGLAHVSSMVYIRYAEMFLNRAEAYAKMDMKSQAIADVNRIRKRAGLQDSAMYNANNMTQTQILNAVLKERRMEFYEEGQRAFDLYRNNITLKRDYPSAVAGHLTIQPNDYRIIWPIPRDAILRNPNLKQNLGYGSD